MKLVGLTGIIIITLLSLLSGGMIGRYLLPLSMTSDQVDFISNLIGGIIGGIVAYIVAAFQIKGQLRADMKMNVDSAGVQLQLIRTELQMNMRLMTDSRHKYFNRNRTFLSHIEYDMITSFLQSPGVELSDDVAEALMKSYKFSKLLISDVEEFTAANYDALIQEYDHTIQLLDDEIARLKRSVA